MKLWVRIEMDRNLTPQILDEVEAKGCQFNKRYHGCAQSTLATLMFFFNLDKPDAFKAATGLGGGIGQTFENTCGALLGGVMAVSLLYGRELNNLDGAEKARATCSALCRKLHERFEREYGSSICKNIHKKIFGRTYNPRISGEWDAYLADGGHDHKCPEVVGKATRWTVELLCSTGKEKAEKRS